LALRYGGCRCPAVLENPYVKSNFLVEAARVDAFSGKLAGAKATLESVIQTATKFGFLNTQLRARLALAEIESKRGMRPKQTFS
jgi:hypothetical protein